MMDNILNKKPLIVLTGPTAVGKTEASIQLAKSINGEIISADSMQVYKGMDIGTAKITQQEMQGIPHYMIDELEPEEEFHVYEFQKRAKKYMNDIWERGKIPIIVGGTGFYIQALLYDIQFTDKPVDDSYRLELQKVAKEKGAEYLHAMLEEVDAQSAKDIHPNNEKRVIRALEYYHHTGEKFSIHNERERQRKSPYSFVYFVLNADRKVLYDRIDKRVDVMIEQGLEQEVKGLLDRGVDRNLVSMQGLGYKEIVEGLLGEVSREESIDTLKKNTRHFAKRQLTWFRREKEVIFVDKENFSSTESLVQYLVKEANQLLRNEN